MENLSKNKIIFSIIGVIFILCIIGIIILLNSQSESKKKSSQTKNFTFWIIGDNKDSFQQVLNDFKIVNTKYKNSQFDVISFPTYEEYYNSLIGSFLNGKTPDIFMLNNNESPLFDLQVLGIDPTILSPDDFRKYYEPVFSQDLIRTIKIDEKDVEFLVGIPVGYETLGLFYNFREIKGKNLSTWSHINDVVRQIHNDTGGVSLGIGHGSSVYGVEDIITQFFLLDGIQNLNESAGDKAKASLSQYARFGDERMENKYMSLVGNLSDKQKNNLNLFSEGKIQMILGYPRMLEEIDKNGFDKSFLRAEPFPMYTKDSGKILINYNYFVMNKNTQNFDTAIDFIKYIASSDGQKKYLEIFPYYFPSQLGLLSDRLEENLKSGYNLKYKHFHNSHLDLTSFKKGMRTIYDKEIALILDQGVKGVELFEILRKRLLCISNKMITGEGLENPCSK